MSKDYRAEIRSPLDVCKCGDYRKDHKEGSGACSMADDLTHGFKPCKRFRLSGAAHQPKPTYNVAGNSEMLGEV